MDILIIKLRFLRCTERTKLLSVLLYSSFWLKLTKNKLIIYDMLEGRPIQSFPWGLDVWRRNILPCLKSGSCLTRPLMTCGHVLVGANLGSWKSNCLSVPRSLCAQSVIYLRCPVLPLWTITWLALLHCMVAFWWLCPISSLKTICKMLHFLYKLVWHKPSAYIRPSGPNFHIFFKFSYP